VVCAIYKANDRRSDRLDNGGSDFQLSTVLLINAWTSSQSCNSSLMIEGGYGSAAYSSGFYIQEF
jgi:hypothetical protein